MESEKVVETTRGQALAEEYSIKFFETSAKNNINVVESFEAIAKDIKKRLMDNPAAGAGGPTGGVTLGSGGKQPSSGGKCCK
jgi:GTPase SAR1 family protein